jgi:hypothetical protein
MSAPDYQDVTSGIMGGVAGKFSPNFYNQSWTTQKDLGQRAYDRVKLGQDWTRTQNMQNLDADKAWRALPAAYNQRGMLDSGQYQRGGTELADAINRRRSYAFQDYTRSMEESLLADQFDLQNLDQYRDVLSSEMYQQYVSDAINDAGGIA